MQHLIRKQVKPLILWSVKILSDSTNAWFKFSVSLPGNSTQVETAVNNKSSFQHDSKKH